MIFKQENNVLPWNTIIEFLLMFLVFNYASTVTFLQFSHLAIYLNFFEDFIYLFLERTEGRRKERERNINVWLPLTPPNWGPGPKPRHVPWLGIEPTALWFTGLALSSLSHISQGHLKILKVIFYTCCSKYYKVSVGFQIYGKSEFKQFQQL